MKKVNAITILSLTAVVLAIMTVPTMAYNADGDLSDWGLEEEGEEWWTGLNEDGIVESWKNERWLPSSDTCHFVVEDNRYYKHTVANPFWPAYRYIYGVHIIGKGSNVGEYEESLINGHAQPSGGEICDFEAMYVDSDASNVYFAIITSVSPIIMGDLKITLPSGTYGIVLPRVLTTTPEAKVYKTSDWQKCKEFPNPWGAGTPLQPNADFRVRTLKDPTGTAAVAYIDSEHPDNPYPYLFPLLKHFDGKNYIIEISVPRSALGSPSAGQLANLYATLWCGNDVIELQSVEFYIPEFTTIAIPVGMIIGLFYFFSRKRKQ